MARRWRKVTNHHATHKFRQHAVPHCAKPGTARRRLALLIGGYAVGLCAYAAIKVVAPAFYAMSMSRIAMMASVLEHGCT